MKKLFYIVILASIATGMIFPQIGKITFLIPYLIWILLVFSFLDIKFKFRNLLRIELLVTILLSAVIMPSLTWYIFSTSLDQPFRLGLLLTACAPAGIMTLILAKFIRNSDYELIFSNFIVTTFSAMVYIPILLKLIPGKSVDISMQKIFFQTVLIIFTPYITSRIIRKYLSAAALTNLKDISGRITLFLVFFIVAGPIGSASADLDWNYSIIIITSLVIVIYMLQGALGYLAGFIFGGIKTRNTLAFIASSRNIQLVIAVSVLNFPPATVIPLVIAIIIHHITNIFWVWLLDRNPA